MVGCQSRSASSDRQRVLEIAEQVVATVAMVVMIMMMTDD
jgi:hypothetical protein